MNLRMACLVGILWGLVAVGGFSAEMQCTDCHDDKDKGAFVHAPVAAGECGSCHESVGGKHPDKKKSLRLVAEGAKLCTMCHEDPAGKKHPHPPASADCTMCHDPHQSKFKFQLKETGPVLCFTCHDASAFSGVSVHEPVATGECTACHNPHGTDYPKMLVEQLTEDFYLPYKREAYSLCFSCHNGQIALDKRSLFQTGFRDGDRNLHYVHVNNSVKGRSCKVCHMPHASKQSKLIREKVAAFGKWDIPFVYEKTATGGACMVGCHKPQSYEREASVSPAQ